MMLLELNVQNKYRNTKSCEKIRPKSNPALWFKHAMFKHTNTAVNTYTHLKLILLLF